MMQDAKFVQIHTLTSYPASLLNRDDAGFAKRIPFGGATRTRVSSQCLKYHWRNFKGENSLGSLDPQHSVRSRQTFTRKVANPLIESGMPERLVVPAVMCLKDFILSDKNTSKTDLKNALKGEGKVEDHLDTQQVTVLGEPEIEYLKKIVSDTVSPLREEIPQLWENSKTELTTEQADQAIDTLKTISKGDLKKNLKELKTAAGLEAAMFGRMTTSDVLARGDAAIHVAHAFTTHSEESESDYFTAVDELKSESDEGELGGGHLNTTELASGLFYGYVVIDVPLLVSNIEGGKREEWDQADKTLAAAVIDKMIHLMSTVTPGAKLGSTAPYAYSECLLVEAGQSQPRTLANAFRRPVETEPDILDNSYRALGTHIADIDRMYGRNVDRKLAAAGPADILVEKAGIDGVVSVDELSSWISNAIMG